MTTPSVLGRALVLGGGGITGIAWELGVLTGLQRGGVDVGAAELVVGTSAGSMVGTWVTAGRPLEDLYADQARPAPAQKAPALDVRAFTQMYAELLADPDASPEQLRAQVGQRALAAVDDPAAEEQRRAEVHRRLGVTDWPQRSLRINAVDAETGEWVVFDHTSGVEIADAVAASCAVPLVWPPVAIAGRRYLDGGIRSASNADLAAGCQRVLAINPISPTGLSRRLGSDLDVEVALLEGQGSQVLVVAPDEAALAAIGPDMLDAQRRAPAAAAGLAQGERLAADVRRLWV